MAFELPPLGFDYNALEPNIDAKTMDIHYNKHHGGYVSKLNAALEGVDTKGRSVEDVLANIAEIPDAKRQAVINNGGGHANHSLFWKLLKPGGSKTPTGDLAAAIDNHCGGLDKFKETFANAAATRFGSGWAWLIMEGQSGDKPLKVISTANQDSPYLEGNRPIIGLDVWEHAYYLNYQNRRPDYITAFWNVLNWDAANDVYKAAKST